MAVSAVEAGAFGFLTLIQVLDGPERYGAFSLFETIPSSPSWQIGIKLQFIARPSDPGGKSSIKKIFV